MLTTTNPNGDKTTDTYNGDGYELTSEQPNGTETYNTYDADNELTAVEVKRGATVEQETETAYDGDGNVISQTNGDGDATRRMERLRRQARGEDSLGHPCNYSEDHPRG